VDIDRLRELLEYEPVTGLLRWRWREIESFSACQEKERLRTCNGWNTKYAGRIAGVANGCGYIVLKIDGRLHLGHRVAVALMTGRWPENYVDHIDRDEGNNRWANLREATNSQNQGNARIWKTNTSGVRGVSLGKDGLYHASITIHGKATNLGSYRDIKLAKKAYDEAAIMHFGEYYKA
jgi:hypothetical protein